MSKGRIRNNLSVVLYALMVWSLLSMLLLADTTVDTSTDRERSPNQANEDSLFIFWEDGSIVGIDLDLRLVVVIIGVLFFISIFSTLMIFHKGGRDTSE